MGTRHCCAGVLNEYFVLKYSKCQTTGTGSSGLQDIGFANHELVVVQNWVRSAPKWRKLDSLRRGQGETTLTFFCGFCDFSLRFQNILCMCFYQGS